MHVCTSVISVKIVCNGNAHRLPSPPLPSPPFTSPPLLPWQEIHQTKGFTKVWWTLKCVMFPLTTTLLIVFLCKTRGRQRVLMERTLAYMGGAVAFMGGEQ